MAGHWRHSGRASTLSEVLVSPEFLGDEVALLLGCSAVSGHRRLEAARAAARHPVMMEYWAAGVVDRASVDVIAELVTPLPADAATHDLVADAVDYATRHTPSQTRVWLTRRVADADPAGAAERRGRASAARRVQLSQGADGMASLWAWLPGAQARQVFDTVHAVAMEAGTDDVRTMDQRRADALVDLVVGRAAPPQVQLQVVASARVADRHERSSRPRSWVSGRCSLPSSATSQGWRRTHDCQPPADRSRLRDPHGAE